MKILVYEGPRKLKVEEAHDFPLLNEEVRIETIYSGISHGTEMNVYKGIAPFFRRKRDPQTKLFVDAQTQEKWSYPIRSSDSGVWYMGYSNVGRIIEIGNKVSTVKLGDIVYSSAPHQSHVIKNARQVVKLPDSIKPIHGVFFTNLITVFNAILDSNIKLGDSVAISGLGVLGQLAMQMAKMSGAHKVFGIDLFEKRLQTAICNGVDKVYNPLNCKDIAYEIRKETNNIGADVVMEISGNQKALNEAIRIAAPDSQVTAVGWYQGQCTALNLSEEFHHNRIKVRCSQTGEIDPAISNTWDKARRQNICMELLQQLKLDNLITHEFALQDAQKAYEKIEKNPSDIIQAVFKY